MPEDTDRRSTVVGDLELREVESTWLVPPESDSPAVIRTVRVWLPPGYREPGNGMRRYPVLIMHDAQNLFDEATSGYGMEWRVDETMTGLLEDGEIDPWIVVGVDHAGERRVGELSLDGAEAMGQTGYGSRYVAFLTRELLPWIGREYRALDGVEHRALGGSSCGGNITLQTVLDAPGVFGRALIESPALWIGDGLLVERLARFDGTLPTHIFVGMGTREYGDATHDASLVEYAKRLEAAFRSAPGANNATAYEALKLVVEPGAGHNEGAWAGRLPSALRVVLKR